MKLIKMIFLAAAITSACCQALKAQESGSWIKADSVNKGLYVTNSLVCADSLNCISLSASFGSTCCTVIRHTGDGGITWQEVYNDSIRKVDGSDYLPPAGFRLSFPEPGFAVVSHDSGYVSISRDTLKTWTKYEEDRNSIKSFYMFDKKYGFKISSYYKFFKFDLEYTTDGGVSWKDIIIPDEYKKVLIKPQIPISAVELMLLCTDEDKGNIIIRYNAGSGAWSHKKCPDYADNMFFLDSLNGWLAVNPSKGSYLGYIVATSDGGSNWEVVCDTHVVNRRIHDIFFYDKNNGIAVGSDYTLIRTKDGGKTWQRDRVMDIPVEKQGTNLYPPINLKDIGYLSHNSGLILGINNIIYRYVANPVSVNDNIILSIEGKAVAYPNPVSRNEIRQVKIKMPAGFEGKVTKAALFSYNGLLLIEIPCTLPAVNNEINLHDLDIQPGSGAYFIKIETAGSIWHLPLIVY